MVFVSEFGFSSCRAEVFDGDTDGAAPWAGVLLGSSSSDESFAEGRSITNAGEKSKSLSST